eukprot:5207406-Pyramimonas_sp.AAC.1
MSRVLAQLSSFSIAGVLQAIEDSYLEEEGYEGDEEYDCEENEEEADFAEELPREIAEAQVARGEACLSFVGAKKRVAEIAMSRGFYPIAALAPENN